MALRGDCLISKNSAWPARFVELRYLLPTTWLRDIGGITFADQVRFFLGSRGSLQELVDDLNVCDDEEYLRKDEVAKPKEEAWRVLGLINGYPRYLRDRKAENRSAVRERYGDSFALLDEALNETPTC